MLESMYTIVFDYVQTSAMIQPFSFFSFYKHKSFHIQAELLHL